ncbi:hypothetical protein KAH94_02605 [bacterium]|nr:hypothetical protein [bacterium]
MNKKSLILAGVFAVFVFGAQAGKLSDEMKKKQSVDVLVKAFALGKKKALTQEQDKKALSLLNLVTEKYSDISLDDIEKKALIVSEKDNSFDKELDKALVNLQEKKEIKIEDKKTSLTKEKLIEKK